MLILILILIICYANVEATNYKTCYHCNGDNCRNPQIILCPHEVNMTINEQCFTKWNTNGELIELGCKSTYSDNQIDYFIYNKQLQLCDDSNCNHYFDLSKKLSSLDNYNVKASLECLHCKSDNCDLPQSKACNNSNVNNQCFILFDSRNNIIEMGCTSDQNDTFIKDNIKHLYMCSNENNCNNYQNIPKPKLCLQCNSRYTTDCAINPGNIQELTMCNTIPSTQCFIHINAEDYSTVRGCASDLQPQDLLTCLSNNSSNCFICNEHKCNTEMIFPENRRSCHRCNSKDNSNCTIWPNSPSICPIYSDDQFCVTKLVNDHTYRGCSTDFECDASDKQYCKPCYKQDNCNVATLKDNNIGYPDKWHGVPLSCYVCEGENKCQNLADSDLYVCNGDMYQNCYTIFNNIGTVIERGCTDSMYGDYCDKYPEYCKFCKSDHCNRAMSLKDYKNCLFCDSSEDANCVINVDTINRTRSCYEACVTAFYPRNKEENPAFELARTCLDDLEESDRNDCNNTYCKACTNDLCNKVSLVERLTCYTCDYDDCELPVSAKCKSYRENDQCFTLFNKEGHIVRLGCGSDLNTDYLKQNKRQLLLCDGDNCNHLKELPMKYTCQECNSQSEPHCSSGNVRNFKNCFSMPFTSCYTRLDEYGITHRGCVADLDDNAFDDCVTYNKMNRTCEICEGNNCNNIVYPADRRSCYRCDSTLYTACEDNPVTFASVCPIYQEDDSCVTKIQNDQTYRGCGSELNCDPNNPEYCRYCNNTNNCNSINLREAYIGKPGQWQNLPLSCLSCEFDGCVNFHNVSSTACKGNILQTCTTVFDKNDIAIMRGCSDDIAKKYEDYCNSNTNYCIECKSNHCNNAENRTTFVDCYFCDSRDNPSCTFNFTGKGLKTRKCHQSCMVALYPHDNSTNPSYELIRTCLDDLEIDDRKKCDAKTNPYCVKCNSTKCNTMNLPQERHQCYFCDNAECENMNSKSCQLYHPNDQCYILIDQTNNIDKLGCRSEISSTNITDLLLKKKLLLCDDINCNTPDIIPSPQKCIKCDSQKDPLCATRPNFITDTEYCTDLPYTNCFIRINKAGHTERGCLSSLDGNNFLDCMMGTDTLCNRCLGDQCNQLDIFPFNRLKCHQCNSVTDPLCATSPNNVTVCPVYKENDKCVAYLSKKGVIRGCASSNIQCDNENDQSCQICETNGCNNANLALYESLPGIWQDLPLSCYTCQNEDDCKEKGVFRPCLNNIFDRCMTVFDEKGSVVRRGCSTIVQSEYAAYCMKNSSKCMSCNSNGCNVATNLNDYVECLSCDSRFHANCISRPTKALPTRPCYKYCMTALYPMEREEDNPRYSLSRSCYDDMDYDDRENCLNNTKNYCKTCNQSRCNKAIMPEKRFHCYICKGDECQDPKSTECHNYQINDQCYIRYNEYHSIVSMGCRSEFMNMEFNELLKQKRLFLCNEENCNNFTSLPSIRKCVLCNSRTDEDCASHPSNVKSKTSCRLMPFTDCYTRILPDGATERGCLSNLYDNEFLTCLNGTSTTCKMCSEDNCNIAVYPKDRLKCHICDSKHDNRCEFEPQSLNVCPIYKLDDKCVTTFTNNTTFRHCHSSLSCESDDVRYCQTCIGDGCNTINLAKISQDNNYGKWQMLPLECLECTDNECGTLNVSHTEICGPNPLQDCVTVFDDNNKVIRRGCSDTVDAVYYGYCQNQSDNCYNCKSNKCNIATSKSDFIECIYCDTNDDMECLWNPHNSNRTKRFCQKGCMTALYADDSDINDAFYNVIRTCLNDKELNDQNECVTGTNKKCISCSTPNCNDHKIPETRLTCYSCFNNDCEKPQSQLCPRYRDDDKCFARFNDENSIIEMGCLSSLGYISILDLIKTKRVAVCSGNNCNDMSAIPNSQICLACNSINEHECATAPKEINTITQCNMMPYTTCYNKLNEDGTTQRGCLSDLPEDDFVNCALNNNRNCSICMGEDGQEICNRDIFPKDRQQCYTCISDEDYNCKSFPQNSKPCPIVSLEESCVTALSENITVRGCRSTVYCDENDLHTCRSCFGTECNAIDLLNQNDDNYHGIWQDLPLKCYTCYGDDCLWSLGVPTLCSTKNIEQDCKTVFTNDGKVKRRGCSDYVDDYEHRHCREHPDLCFTCKSNECNIAWNLNDYIECLFCDSQYNLQCIQDPTNMTILRRQCYRNCMVTMQNDRVIRSCLDDLELQDQKKCNSDNVDDVECSVCTKDNCNQYPLPQNRLKCHTCNDALCRTSISQYCVNYTQNDYCFTKYSNSRSHIELLGCLSSLTEHDINNWSEQHLLYKCSEDDCNELSITSEVMTCVKCDSRTEPNCAQYPERIRTIESCVPYDRQCATQILSDGHTLRGCSLALNVTDQFCTDEGLCETCSTNNCNWPVFPPNRRQCFICNTTDNNKCIDDRMNIQVCPIYDQDDACVTKRQNDIVIRGCKTDITCDSDSGCNICNTNACNVASSIVSVHSIQIISIILIFLSIYIYICK